MSYSLHSLPGLFLGESKRSDYSSHETPYGAGCLEEDTVRRTPEFTRLPFQIPHEPMHHYLRVLVQLQDMAMAMVMMLRAMLVHN